MRSKRDGVMVLVIMVKLGLQTAIAQSPPFTVKITPNPVNASMRLTVKGLPANEDLSIRIYRDNGTIVYRGAMRITGKITVKRISRPMAPPGLYFYFVIRKKTSQIIKGSLVLL